jgi:Rrf2 family protein
MAHFGASVEYALHCLLWLVEPPEASPSSRDLAEFQGAPVPYMAKIFPKLEKAGIVTAAEGIKGGYRLAKPANRITVLEVADAVEGEKPLFDCQEIRGRCALFDGTPPRWAVSGVCEIHAVMLRAERLMREELSKTTLASLADGVAQKAPVRFGGTVHEWFDERTATRSRVHTVALQNRRTKSDAEPK